MIGVPLAGVDEQHLAGADLAGLRSIVEMQPSVSHYQRDWNRVPMLGDTLARLQAQADDSHRAAVGYLLEAKRSRRFGTV